MTQANIPALDALATKIRDAHAACQEAARKAVERAVACGELLNEAKAGVPHGEWQAWLDANCEISDRTARAYMRLARKARQMDGAKRQRVLNLPLRQAMVEIADTGGTPLPAVKDFDAMWAWAGKWLDAPFGPEDFDQSIFGDGWTKMVPVKLLYQIDPPAIASFCLSCHTDDAPLLHAVPADELINAFRLVADATLYLEDIAEGKEDETLNLHRHRKRRRPRKLRLNLSAALDRDISSISLLHIEAARFAGALFTEVERREKRGDIEFDEAERQQALGLFIDQRDAQLAELRARAA